MTGAVGVQAKPGVSPCTCGLFLPRMSAIAAQICRFGSARAWPSHSTARGFAAGMPAAPSIRSFCSIGGFDGVQEVAHRRDCAFLLETCQGILQG